MKQLIGQGILSWHPSERRTDRYGTVMLMAEGMDSYSDKDQAAPLNSQPEEGLYGELIAVITQNRESTHIGDLFRGVFPSIPDIGEEIILGKGLLFYDTIPDLPYTFIGLCPIDGRDIDWLDINSLYRCHEQSVNLYFKKCIEN